MAKMLEECVTGIMDDNIREKYPYIRNPICVRACVTSAKEKGGGYVYSLKILDKNGNRDGDYPEIPGIKSDRKLEKGDTAAVMLFYGDIADMYILGRVIT